MIKTRNDLYLVQHFRASFFLPYDRIFRVFWSAAQALVNVADRGREGASQLAYFSVAGRVIMMPCPIIPTE